ncbi:MAG: DUF86 domain-containing protein [Spirochaetales bacterium]|uniref:DUF86 domain-containing protein n=1 Tax=Candidatus Thalassospirochaeta sargassi TaxID=3119039 RepID=A0AAJ1IB99_9SPIO|nr:DUF86 domain-containing protein [Spirochaetales bacterium]
MKEEYSDYLNDIIKSMELSQEFIINQTLHTFKEDNKTQFAVIRCLEVIGEATKRLPEELRAANPKIPWRSMAGMRDRLIHGYDVVDSEIVWITVTKTIPELIDKIKEIEL